jgi:hypothetical protein
MAKRLPVKSLQSIRKHRYILQKLASAKPAQRKTMLLSAPTALFNVFKTLCKLVTDGYLQLGKAKRYKKLVNKIGKTKISGIKAIVKQQGGAIASILGGVLPFLTPLISKIFK